MKHVDYIVVGCGLAGIAFCEQLRVNNKSFVVFDNSSQTSSGVAGGLYNPVILKRFTPVWKSRAQLDIAIPNYQNIEKLLDIKLDYQVPVYRLFNSIEEQNNWFTASDKVGLSEFLFTGIIKNDNNHIKAPFGFGKVLQTGRIDTLKLIQTYRTYLETQGHFFKDAFEYESVKFQENNVEYINYQAAHIIFAEGFGVKKNPFFKELPLNGTKGELLTIHAPELKMEYVLKSSVFIIPLGEDLYRIGATYHRDDKTNTITEDAREELLKKLKTFLHCEFTVVNQVAGIRPTVAGRRPLVGSHASYKNVHILNGLGSRGVMIAPYVAKQLYDFIEHQIPLEEEIDVSRF
jgi:glycine/D-amino acid oxidase-like deaminating enzyme